MSEKIAFVDSLRNAYDQSPKEQKEELKRELKRFLEDFLKEDFDAKVDRWLEPPSMGVIDVTNANFTQMLNESIMCYVFGFYYSTISICEITTERLCMDVLLRHKLSMDERTLSPNDFNLLFVIPHKKMIDLLHGWSIISETVKNKLYRMNDIRNTYVHPDVITTPEQLKKAALEILTLLKYVLSQSFSSTSLRSS